MEQSHLKSLNSLDKVVIATHDKKFHVDDVGAVSLLTGYLKSTDTEVSVIRTRELALLENADILVDVGGVYDPDIFRYDHHQVNCNETFSSSTTIPMSSIGMVWKHHGKDILIRYIESHESFCLIENWQEHIESLHREVYMKIIQELDAHDNGIQMIEGGRRNYWTNLHLASVISSSNTFNTNDEEKQMVAFRRAMELFGNIFELKLSEIIRKYFDYQTNLTTVKNLLDNTTEDFLIIVNQRINTIFTCLNKLDPKYRIKFLIIKESDETEYTVKTRSRKENPYYPIIPLNTEEVLREKLDDIVFVHKNLFIAKTKSLQSAIEIVKLACQGDESLKVLAPRKCPLSRTWMVIGGIVGVVGGIFIYHNSN